MCMCACVTVLTQILDLFVDLRASLTTKKENHDMAVRVDDNDSLSIFVRPIEELMSVARRLSAFLRLAGLYYSGYHEPDKPLTASAD